MKRKIAILLGAILLLISTVNTSTGNQNNFVKPEDFKEEIELITNRQIYVVNENVYFMVYNLSSEGLKDVEWSKVIYLELIAYDGKPLLQAKYKFNREGAQGSFQIPKSILTGNYYLKIYTRWMRNYGPLTYYYKPITILNPYESTILAEPTSYLPQFEVDTINPEEYFDKGIFDGMEELEAQNYYTLQKKNLDSLNSGLYTISIIKKIAFEDIIVKVRPLKVAYEFKPFFIPETRTISLSGTLLNTKLQKPLSFKTINLTIFNHQTQSLSVFSDTSGRFFFALPELYGEKELVITSSIADDADVLIQVDNDFCPRSVYLPFIPYKLDESKRDAINELIVDSQIENQFKVPKDSSNVDSAANFEIQYFAQPTISIKLDEYIPLPSLNDYFHELIPFIGFNKNDGKKVMQVYGPSYDLKIYEPLVMVDHVIITDIDKLLAVSPAKIEKIEMINSPYIKGDITYGGVVAIYSKTGDIAGIDLPQFSQIFNFKMYYPSTPFSCNDATSKNEPRISNSLFWYIDNGKSTNGVHSTTSDKKSFQNENRNFRISISDDKSENQSIPPAESFGTNAARFYTGENFGEYVLIYTQITPDGLKQSKQNIWIK